MHAEGRAGITPTGGKDVIIPPIRTTTPIHTTRISGAMVYACTVHVHVITSTIVHYMYVCTVHVLIVMNDLIVLDMMKGVVVSLMGV